VALSTDERPTLDSQQVGALLEAALDRYSRFDGDCPEPLREAIRYSLLAPGKRLRPRLVLMAADACDGGIEAAMPAACAVEMVHAYSLVHDDLPAMDDDDLRRGRPTCHKVYGEAMAILVGDALQARAFELLASEIKPAEVAAQCCAILGRAAGASALVGGQAADLAMATDERKQAEGTLADLEAIHRRKTGALIRACLELGATVGGASSEQLAALSGYGQRVGLAFQITDDLLDVAGTEATVGKRLTKDADGGKLTFPRLLGVEASRKQASALVRDACGMLEIFGRKAQPLNALAKFVCERDN